MGKCYDMVKSFKRKYPFTICFRLRKHCAVIEKHLNPGEEIIYAFPAQKNSSSLEIFFTNVVALTNKRIIVATKRVIWGYFLVSITPDMFNDLNIKKNLIFGSVLLDTVKEVVVLSNIDPRALAEIETNMSEYMIQMKKEYVQKENNKN